MPKINKNQDLIHSVNKSFFQISIPVIITAILVFLSMDFLSAEARSISSAQSKIGFGVLESIRDTGSAQVMVSLVESDAYLSSLKDISSLKTEVAFLQESVLNLVDSDDFIAKDRYKAVPALGGRIMSEDAVFALASHPNVRKIDLDVGGKGHLSNSVPFIKANEWHTEGITGTGVTVAILDSGIDLDHPNISGSLVHEACFADNDGSIDGNGRCPNGSDRQFGAGAAEDDAGHGTHVTGIVASQGISGSVGVAPGVDIVAIRVTYGPSFSGSFYTFYEVVAALDYIIANLPEVKIINMSLGTFDTFSGDCDNTTSWLQAGAAAINTLQANGVIAFASAGNDYSGTDMTAPACLSNVISVGATDNADNVAAFSNSNSKTDIFAPGVSVYSSDIGGMITASGTSMASPHAAGCAALLVAGARATTPDRIETWMESSPYTVTDTTNGLSFPRIDCSFYEAIFIPLIQK